MVIDFLFFISGPAYDHVCVVGEELLSTLQAVRPDPEAGEPAAPGRG